MKRLIAAAMLGAAVLCLFTGCHARGEEKTVSVESVSMITGVGAAGTVDRYAGKVVSGESAEIKKDTDKTVSEVFVEEGDMVDAGDVLFAYDTEAMQLSLDKLYLDKESYENTVTSSTSEITELETQKAKAPSDQQLSYTLQIDSRKADIREAQYNIALKEREIEAMETSMENTEVTAPIAGRVMSVGEADTPGDYDVDGGGTGTGTDAFVTIMDVSAFRVEGQINELNYGALMEEMPVLVRSRVDDTVWHGVIEKIDWEKPLTSSGSDMYGGNTDEMTSSSKYPFYIAIEENEGLLLGQHVYIEPDFGQEDETGLLLPSWYINDAEGSAWVWAANVSGKLEKRSVSLGEYDADLERYEILSGLGYSDYIAFPDETLSEGMTVVYYDEASFGGGDEEYYAEEDMGYYEEEFFDGEEAVFEEDGFSGEDAWDEEEVYDEASSEAEPLPEEDMSGEGFGG